MKKNNQNVQISFRKLMDFIECGEEAEILLLGKRYKLRVELNNKDFGTQYYYVDELKFTDKESFLNYIYKDSSIQLDENTSVTLLSIGEGVKVDKTWFKNDKKTKIQKAEADRFVLFRNIITRFCITWIVLILVVLILIKDIQFFKLEQIVITLLCIFLFVIAYLPKNINRLKILIKYKKNQIEEIEKSIKSNEKNNFFDEIYVFENHLIKLEKHYFEVIKYDDILWVFKEIYYSRRGSKSQEYNSWLGFKNYGETIVITKDKKIHKIGYISKEQILKDKILEKNPNVLFGESKSITKKTKELHRLSKNNINIRIIIKDFIKVISILLILYLLIQF